MARKKAAAAVRDDLSARYQLTPEQKIQAREEMRRTAEEAARNGVYEKVRALRGTVRLEYDVEELRRDHD